MFNIIYSKSFAKVMAKFFKKHPELKTKFKQKVKQLENDPFNKNLKTHKLKGKLQDYHACSLDNQYRIIITIIMIDKVIYLIDIGNHNNVYNH